MEALRAQVAEWRYWFTGSLTLALVALALLLIVAADKADDDEELMSGMTHKGWFWFCPIYLGNLDHEDGAQVCTRWAILEPLFSVCMWLEGWRIRFTCMLLPDYEPLFQFKITGELAKPDEHEDGLLP